MRSLTLLRALLVVSLLLAPLAVSAHDGTHESADACGLVSLVNGWVRPAGEGAPVSAAYGLLVNLTDEPDTLIAAATDAAGVVELHEMQMDGDVMRMRPVDGGITVAPHGFTELAPGGLHLMLLALPAPLEAGSTVDIVLTFEHAGDVALALPVLDPSAAGETHSDHAAGHSHTPVEVPQPSALTADDACVGMYLLGAWARPAGEGVPNSAAYGLLLNLTGDDDTLVAAETEAVAAVELHEMTVGDGDVMRMRPVDGGIPLPAGRAVALQSGGLHLMLIGVVRPLAEGSALDMTLRFAHADAVTLSVPVGEPASDSTAPMHDHGGM